MATLAPAVPKNAVKTTASDMLADLQPIASELLKSTRAARAPFTPDRATLLKITEMLKAHGGIQTNKSWNCQRHLIETIPNKRKREVEACNGCLDATYTARTNAAMMYRYAQAAADGMDKKSATLVIYNQEAAHPDVAPVYSWAIKLVNAREHKEKEA